jgi:hypothetical protein
MGEWGMGEVDGWGGAAPSAPEGMDGWVQHPPTVRTGEGAGSREGGKGCTGGCADRGCDGAQPPRDGEGARKGAPGAAATERSPPGMGRKQGTGEWGNGEWGRWMDGGRRSVGAGTLADRVSASQFGLHRHPSGPPMRPVFFALAAGFATLAAAAPVSAQSLVEFRFAPVPASVVQGVPFPIRIEAVDPSGAPATHLAGPLSLTARHYGPPSIVISEVAGDLGAVEFTNPGASPVAVGDWELQAIHSGNPGQNPVRVRIPSPAVVPARGTFVWSPSMPAPGNFPELGSPRPFAPPGAELGAFRLLNPEGQLVDVVLLSEWAGDAAEGHWNGGALGTPSDAGRSRQRIGGANTGSAWDWTTNTPSLGIPNSGLALPWLGAGRPITVEPGSVAGAAGVWQGLVTFPEAGDAVTLLVDAGDGRLFESALMQVLPRPALALEIPPAARAAQESAAGPVGEGFVRLPSPVSSNLTVVLHLDSPGEFFRSRLRPDPRPAPRRRRSRSATSTTIDRTDGPGSR